MPVIDKQMKMKLQGELAFINERLEQIKQNRDQQGFYNYELELWLKRKSEILTQLH